MNDQTWYCISCGRAARISATTPFGPCAWCGSNSWRSWDEATTAAPTTGSHSSLHVGRPASQEPGAMGRGLGWALIALLLASPAVAQTRYWEASEVLGGAAYNVALRAPMAFAPKPYRGPVVRALVFTLGSLAYEMFVDPSHQMQDSIGRWTSVGQQRMDVKNRQIGYVAMEAVVLGVTWIVRRVRHRP